MCSLSLHFIDAFVSLNEMHHIQTQGTIETAPGVPEPIRLEVDEVQQEKAIVGRE